MPLFRKRNDRPNPSIALASAGGPQARSRAVSQSSNASVSSSNAGPDIANGRVLVGSVDSHDSTTSLEAFGKRPRSLLLQPGMCQDPDTADWVMNTDPLKPQTPMLTSSRLSKTLGEVLHDKEALPYFIQYMASKGGEQIIKFWLDAESFQASSWTRIRTHSLKTVQQQTLLNSPQHSDSSTSKSDSCSKDADLPHFTVAAPVAGDCSWDSSGPTTQPRIAMTTGEDSVDGGCPQASGTSASAAPPQSLTSLAPVGTDASTVPPEFATPVDCEPLCSPHTDCGTTHKPHQMSSPESRIQGGGVSMVAAGDSQSGSSCLEQEIPVPVEEESEKKKSPASSQSEDSFQDKLRKSIERDAVTIYSKYISLDATHPIGISEHLLNETISKICREDGQVDPLCFARCQDYVVSIMDNVYFQGFLQSEFHCKHQIDILTGTQVHLADVLYNESALFYFMEYMEQEGAMDLLQCWLAMDNFQQQLSERHGYYDGMEAQNDAMVIYEKYFSLQCTSPLGFEDKVRMEVELNICREEGPLPDCFATPKKQVLRTIEKVYFPRFIQNELYSKYLNELISTIQLAHDLPMTGHRRTGSDASSEKSLGSTSANSEPISSKNTLLATSSTTYQKTLNPKVINKITDDMRIDSVLFNPDALWKRSQPGKNMSLGRVNEVGQFVSELDPEPDIEKKKKGFFSLRKQDGQSQEEVALQIAQMIVSDVTRVTQGGATGGQQS